MQELAEFDETDVQSYSRLEPIEHARQDLNFLAGLAMPEVFVFLFPKLFVALYKFIREFLAKSRDFSKLAIGIPRGFAKTTFVKIVMLYIILFTQRKFILVISHVQAHGVNIVKDVIDMLSHPNIRNLFGDWATNVIRDRQEIKEFHFRGRRITLAAVGSEGNIRGLNVGHARPDVMIFEDFQPKEASENLELSEKLYQHMLGTIMKAKNPAGCLFIFVANMYPTPGSILKKLKNNKDWISFIVGGILADGTSLWEELQPIEQLVDEYQADENAGHPEIFNAEVLNDENAGMKVKIDLNKIPVSPYSDESEEPQGRIIIIDPAMDNPNSDYNGILQVGIYDGMGVAEKIILDRLSPMDLIKQALAMALESRTRVICVEIGAYQGSLLFWFNFVCSEEDIQGFTFVPITSGGVSKNGRIGASLKSIMAAQMYINNEVRGHWVHELMSWNPLKRNNNDTALDLVAYIPKALEEHGALCELASETYLRPAIPVSTVYLTNTF